MSVSNELHLAKTSFVTTCERVYAPTSAYRNGMPEIHVVGFDRFAPAIAAGKREPCGQCLVRFRAAQIRLLRAGKSVERQVGEGISHEEALASVRNHFDLAEYEELALRSRLDPSSILS